ncbi:MAG: prolipoprotein diacylglyceryl transferase, partial [Alphaproteobacteria bacterium]|nr:prolipoprotein diacylglyceryl transferase [Alphaproteobacteria bacterium]
MPLNAIVLPYLDPVLIEVGPLALRWYSLAYIIGIMFTWFYGIHKIARNPKFWHHSIPPYADNPPEELITWGTIGLILGGRLGHVIFYEPSLFIHNPLGIFAIWKGGMSFHGGLIGVVLAMFIFANKNYSPLFGHKGADNYKINAAAWVLVDGISILAPIGLFLGRIGNFINAEILGAPTDLPWAVIFPGDGIPRHPTQ